MRGYAPAYDRTIGTDELHIVRQLLHHTRVLSPHGAVHHWHGYELAHRPGGPHGNSAVDDHHFGAIPLHISRSDNGKLLDLRRVADMQELDRPTDVARREVDSLHSVRPLEHLQQRSPHFSQSEDHTYRFRGGPGSLSGLHCSQAPRQGSRTPARRSPATPGRWAAPARAPHAAVRQPDPATIPQRHPPRRRAISRADTAPRPPGNSGRWWASNSPRPARPGARTRAALWAA